MPMKKRMGRKKVRKGLMKKGRTTGRTARPSGLGSSNRTFKWKTTSDYGTIISSVTGLVNQSYSGSILEVDNTPNLFGGVGQLTCLRALYDEYKIDAVKFTFVPLYTQSMNIATGNASGQVAYAINRAPVSAVPSRFTDVLRQNDCKAFNTNRGFSVTVRKPQWNAYVPIDNSISTTGFVGESRASYCACRDFATTQTQPNWYGIDLAIENAPPSTPLYRLMKTYYISFRSQS